MRRSSLRRAESLTDKYRILGKIGEGTYGMVFKAEAYSSALLPRPTSAGGGGGSGSGSGSGSAGAGTAAAAEDEEPMTFAIKLVKPHKEGKNDVVLSSATVREIKLLRELQHDNVMHLHDVHVDPREKTLALVFEYGDHDLHDIIVQSKQKPLGEYTRKSLMFQILKGVDYMHDAWVMHRDMKPQNILVVGHGRKRGQVKLGDFGLARIYREPIKALTDVERVVVTLWYRAPELLLGAKHYTKAVDLWAVGCIFAELINTRELFCGKEVEGSNAPFQKDQLDKIFKVLGLPTPAAWEGLEHLPEYPHVLQMARERKYPSSSELKNAVKFGPGRAGAALYDLIARLLEYDPEKRITAKEALEHEYFKEIEPEPRDWAFDEPGKEPVSFRTQTVEPVAEEQLPWKTRKDGAAAGDGAKGDGASSPHRDGAKAPSHPSAGAAHGAAHGDASYRAARDARSRSHHSSSRDPPPRRSERQQQQQQQHGGGGAVGAPPSGAGAAGSAWRDRSAARGSGPALSSASTAASGKRPSGSSSGGERQASASASGAAGSGRPRSPKQQRRR